MMHVVEHEPSFERLGDRKFVLLTTFRKDGTPVATPVCHVVNDGVIYLTTLETTGKARRIRRQGHVQVAASDPRGNVQGPTYDAQARILTDEELRQRGPLKRSRWIGAIFPVLGGAHWIVRPMQIYERLRFRRRFVGIAIVPTTMASAPGEAAA